MLLNRTCNLYRKLSLRTQSSCYVHRSFCSSVNNTTSVRNASFPAIKSTLQKLRQSNDTYGQPTPISHPHILKEGEVVQSVKADELKSRRIRFMELIQEHSMKLNNQNLNHIAIIPSSVKKYMSDKIPYVFRQNSDFLYLSGCLEPNSVLIVTINSTGQIRSTLFMRPKDKHAELWDGPRTGVENSPEFFGVDSSYSFNELQSFILDYIHQESSFSIWYDSKASDQPEVTNILKSCLSNSVKNTFDSPTIFAHKMRVVKSKSEVNLMRTACVIASEAINQTISESKAGDSEHHLFARVDYHCRMRNSSFLAYPPVVASGTNGTTIHYINNSQIVNSGDLVLMDAGCEFGGYSSDITRTWPIDGVFSEPQKILYEILLVLQKELIENLLNEGGRTLDDLFNTMCVKLGKYLQEVGLVSKSLNELEVARAAYNFCPHHVSHYLGMDVHDTPLMSRNLTLAPGMICTVEPGIYIGADRKDVPKEFRGIGIRIEDDVLITSESSVEVLTQRCEKYPEKFKELIDSHKKL